MDTNNPSSTDTTQQAPTNPQPVVQNAPTPQTATNPSANQPVGTPSVNPPKKPFNKSLLLIIVAIVVLLAGMAFAAWYFQSQLKKTEASDANIKAPVVSKQLIVGTDPTFQPMEYIENNTLVGYDIDLANALAKEMNTTVQIKQVPFDNIFTALERSEIDMIISGITITDERKAKYDLSIEYLNAGQVLITKKDNTQIRSTADLRGKRISLQKGTSNEEEALKYTDADKVLRHTDFEEASRAVSEGKSDAIFTDLPNAKAFILTHPTLKIASDPFTKEYYGIVFREDDPQVKEVNAALKALRVKGILTDLKQKWLD